MKKTTRSLGRALGAGAFALALGALATGCGATRVTSGGPFAGAVSTPEGTIRYALSKSVVTVEAVVTRGASGAVTFDGNDFSVDTRLVRKDARASVEISSVADEDQFFTLRLEHGGTSDDDLSVQIAPNGVLRSIGVSSTSQLGTTIRNVVTVASSAAAAIAAAALSGDPHRQAAALVCEKLAGDAGVPGRCPAAGPPPRAPTPPARLGVKGESKGGAGGAPAAPSCDKLAERSLGELSMENLYFLARSVQNRQLWQERRDAEGRLQERICRRIDLERQVERASGRDLPELQARLDTQVLLERAARVDLRAASEELDGAVRAFQLETGIDAPPQTEAVRMTFELDEIPSPDMLRGALTPDEKTRVTGMTPTQVRAALKAYPKMLELYDRTGLALTLTPAPYIARGGTVWDAGAPDAPKTHIYYRPAYTAVLTTFATVRAADEQGGEQELLRFFSAVTDEVIHPKMPVQGLAFAPADFAERRISLGFDEKGRLSWFEQSGKSSVVGATTAAADALRTVRDEYTYTLSQMAQIQETRRQLDSNDVLNEIDRLRKQRDLLDARLELAGTRGSYDLLLERRRIDAELAVAQGRNALDAEKGAASSATVSQEVADLRRKLDQLQRDMEELKHRQESQTPTTHAPIQQGR